MITWSTTELCQDKDLIGFEEQALEWCKPRGDAKHWRNQAKLVIEEKLRFALIEKDRIVNAGDYADDVELLDFIANPEVLKTVACYYTLYLIANNCMTRSVGGGDFYAMKAAHYERKFGDDWATALARLHFDLDESDDITSSEKYNMQTGVVIERGL